MTIIGFSDLPPNEREPYNLANHFLSGRLEEWATANWALALKPWQNAERAALQDTYLHQASHPLTEPWRAFWGWLLESWTTAPPAPHEGVSPYQIGELICRGDRSGRTINEIVDVVRPYVVISKRCRFPWPGEKKTEKATRPRRSRFHPPHQRSVARRGRARIGKSGGAALSH